jgi:tetratricopeptide (TPR) repeat protein
MIVENDYLKGLGNIPLFFSSKLTTGFIPQGMYRPLTMLTYLLNFWSAGLKSFYYHLINLLLHILNISIVYLVLNYLWKDLEPTAVFLAVSLFAIHPLNSQAVNFLSSRATLLFTFFYLLSFYLYLKDKLWISFLAFAIGLLSKEEMITLPFLILIYELIYKRKLRLKKILPFVALSLFYLLWRRYLFGAATIIYRVRAIKEDLLLGLLNLPFYFRLTLWPRGFSVEHPLASLLRFSMLNLIYIFAFYLILILGIIYCYRKDKLAAFCLLWPAIAISPFLFISFNNPLAEHRFYLGFVGLTLVLGYILDKLIRHSYQLKATVTGVGLSCILGLSLLTLERNAAWKDELSLWLDARKTAPLSDRLHNNLGREYLLRGEYNLAEEELKLSIRLNPLNYQAHYNLGLLYAYLKRIDEAVTEFKIAVKILPAFAAGYNNLAVAYLSYQPPKIDLAREAASEALRLNYPVDKHILEELKIKK